MSQNEAFLDLARRLTALESQVKELEDTVINLATPKPKRSKHQDLYDELENKLEGTNAAVVHYVNTHSMASIIAQRFRRQGYRAYTSGIEDNKYEIVILPKEAKE